MGCRGSALTGHKVRAVIRWSLAYPLTVAVFLDHLQRGHSPWNGDLMWKNSWLCMFHALVLNKRSYFRDESLGVASLRPPDWAWFVIPPLFDTETSDGLKFSTSLWSCKKQQRNKYSWRVSWKGFKQRKTLDVSIDLFSRRQQAIYWTPLIHSKLFFLITTQQLLPHRFVFYISKKAKIFI